MAKMKVHELAKELDKQSKDIISFLQEKGVEVKAAQSSIDDAAIEMVRKAYGGTGGSQVKEEKKAAPKDSAKGEKPQAEPRAAVQETQNNPAVQEKQNKPSVQETQNKPAAQEERSKSAVQEERSKPAAQGKQSKPDAQGESAQDAPKKKKKIIFASNPQNSKMASGVKGGGQGQRGSQGRPMGNNAGARGTQPNRPIKPLTPPSPTPSVQMVSSVRPQQAKPRPEQQEDVKKTSEAVKEQAPAQADRNARPMQERSQGQSKGYDSSRSQSGIQGERSGQRQGGQYDRDRSGSYDRNRQGGQFDRDRDRNGQYQNRGGAGNGRQGGMGQGRPGFAGGQGDRRGNGNSAGGGRPYNGNGQGGRPDGRQGDRFRDNKPGKSFGGEAPVKDNEKHREEEKRRISQEKDKRNRKDYIYEEEDVMNNKPGRFIKPEKKKEEVVEETIKVIVLPETVTIKELADKMKLQPAAIIKKLFMEGKIVTVNQEISYEDAENIAMEYDILCEKEVKVDVIEELLKEDEENEADMESRPPVICVMGHVDHGKTSLLDAIRQTNVTDKEAGGITQHIGAYTVNVSGKKITFLDTPGHEAFTAMRMRGANATDIAILVVAADDGVMPQTIEAINHAKAAGIEIIVAVNKIDKPSANIERVKQELTEYGLIAEDWGGSTVFAPVSAKTGEGIDQLLEMILLTADILELKANPNRRARGLVIEAELDKGRGPVATVLVQKGTLHVGDFISAGAAHGKVRAMVDDKGRRVKDADPSTPVEILGLSDVPNAGEVFIAHDTDKEAKSYADTYLAQNKEKMLEDTKTKMSLDDLFSQIQEGNLKELNLIVKADVQGSVEAVKQSLMKLSNEEVVVKCIHGGVGAINESDVTLASASNAIIIGFNVRPDVTAKATAEREGVDVRLYKVIYQAIEDIEAAMKGMLDPIFEEKVIGHAEVRQIFKASAVGNIAGSYVLDGTIQRGCKVRITREGEQIFEGELASLKRFKDDVKEVKSGFECGLVFEGFDQMQELDIVEAYIMVEVPR